MLGNRVDGGNCELIAVPAVNVIPIPDSLDFNQAASLPLVFTTAWHMLVGRGGIRPGQTVLVLGASSGVGIAAIQIAKLFHARVITTAGTRRNWRRPERWAPTTASTITSRRFLKKYASSPTRKAWTSSSNTWAPPPGTRA